MSIYRYIVHIRTVLIELFLAVSVTEQIDYCTIRVLLKTCSKNRIVAEEKLSLLVLDAKCIGNLNDVVPACVPSNLRWSIVITNYEMDTTIELIKYFVDVIVISTEEKIPST